MSRTISWSTDNVDRMLSVRGVLASAVLLCAFLLASAALAGAQKGAVTGTTATPAPGAGHDYIGLLNETVDPASGSVSVHIQVPVPQGRGLTVPFSISYNSNGAASLIGSVSTDAAANVFVDPQWLPPTAGIWSSWSYDMPKVSFSASSLPMCTGPSCEHTYYCHVYTGFVLRDASGGSHQLNVSFAYPDPGDGGTNACQYNSAQDGTGLEWPNSHLSGGDGHYRAWIGLPGCPINGSGACDLHWPQSNSNVNLYVVDPAGTVYTFALGFDLPASIEDRNGNLVNGTDSASRRLSISSFQSAGGDTITVPGLGGNYTVTWGTASVNWTPGNAPIPGSSCSGSSVPAQRWTNKVITAITLPNGQQYRFGYDQQYGLLNQITYPSGAYVQYVWGPSSNAAQMGYTLLNYGQVTHCIYTYDKPAVWQRHVSFDGQTDALVQYFRYDTTWNYNGTATAWGPKTTTVTTNDTRRGGKYDTVYTYSSVVNPEPPDTPLRWTPGYLGADWQIPVEQTVQYYDRDGALLRTTTKHWFDQFDLACELETLDNGMIGGTFYTYGPGGVVTDVKEYQYGQLSSTSSCVNGGTAPGSSTPYRETATTYQVFAATPTFPASPSILDRPCKVVTNSNGTSVAETDYLYDGGTAVCGTAGSASVASANSPVQHDSAYANTISPQPPRGNVTKQIKQCFPNCQDPTPTTTFAYDETGQVVSTTDPNLHTTTYSYADSYASGTPPGNTNTYLTQITYPPTNGVSHVKRFSYAYASGQLTQSTDQNNQSTGYQYNDPFARPTQISYPDGAKAVITYFDSPYNPSANTPCVATSTSITNANPPAATSCNDTSTTGVLVKVAAKDGLGHVVRTLGSDAAGTDITDTTYDGDGRVWKVTNPYRGASAPPNTTTTFTYDALGRTTLIVRQDGSMVRTKYSGNCTTVVDEAAKTRKSCADAFGRLIEVDEAVTSPF